MCDLLLKSFAPLCRTSRRPASHAPSSCRARRSSPSRAWTSILRTSVCTSCPAIAPSLSSVVWSGLRKKNEGKNDHGVSRSPANEIRTASHHETSDWSVEDLGSQSGTSPCQGTSRREDESVTLEKLDWLLGISMCARAARSLHSGIREKNDSLNENERRNTRAKHSTLVTVQDHPRDTLGRTRRRQLCFSQPSPQSCSSGRSSLPIKHIRLIFCRLTQNLSYLHTHVSREYVFWRTLGDNHN